MSLRRRRARAITGQGSERGSVSTWLVLAAFAMVLIVGLAVDLSGQVHTQQRVRDVAAQAARVGGQQLDATAVQGAYPSIAVAQARTAAQDYLAAADTTGSVTVSGGTTIHVQVTSTYHPTFLGVVGIAGLTVSGEASARVIRTMGDTER